MCKEIDERDLRIEHFSYAVEKSPTMMKITHLPTGCSVQGEGTSHVKLRQILLKQLVDEIKSIRK